MHSTAQARGSAVIDLAAASFGGGQDRESVGGVCRRRTDCSASPCESSPAWPMPSAESGRARDRPASDAREVAFQIHRRQLKTAWPFGNGKTVAERLWPKISRPGVSDLWRIFT